MSYCNDPYDIWALESFGNLKIGWYRGAVSSKIILPLLGAVDFLAPVLVRRIISVERNFFPHVEAMLFLAGLDRRYPLNLLRDSKIPTGQGWGWGLPFGWYSKNGFYPSNTPYITNTPYVMEALLTLAEQPALRDKAMALFHGTWGFLESLHVMHEGPDNLALSYAPVDEPRVVVNANAYAAFAYGLHAMHGMEHVREVARERAKRLARWVVRQQQADSSWFYYADQEPGNFIDCFHSCFVVKNLIKTRKLIPEIADEITPSINRGWEFIRSRLYNERHGLCRRFITSDIRDPFRWDLYDQAEYLGLLVDFGLLEEAREFRQRVEFRFRKGKLWYCRIDIFGRRWGKNFQRWGIAPFLYHKARLDGK
jgi:hypothetical protein